MNQVDSSWAHTQRVFYYSNTSPSSLLLYSQKLGKGHNLDMERYGCG